MPMAMASSACKADLTTGPRKATGAKRSCAKRRQVLAAQSTHIDTCGGMVGTSFRASCPKGVKHLPLNPLDLLEPDNQDHEARQDHEPVGERIGRRIPTQADSADQRI